MKYRLRIKITLVIAALLMIAFMCVKIAVLVGLRESTETTRWIEFFGVISLIPISALLIKDFINSTKDTQVISAAWSNIFGILLTNAFSIVGTIMGIKYATENKQ